MSTLPTIVAIGASAGGLHSLQYFLAVLPKDFGFSVVFMQHLSKKHKSLLAELLNKSRPDLVIFEVSDDLEVLSGKICRCPPGQDVRISKRIFHTSHPDDEYVYLPIDEFFASLAEEVVPGKNILLFKSLAHKKCRIYEKVETKPSARMPIPVPFAAENTEKLALPQKAEECMQSVTGIVHEALLFLFVFKGKSVANEYPEETRLEASAVEETAVRQLETGLAASRQDLQSNIEQFRGGKLKEAESRHARSF